MHHDVYRGSIKSRAPSKHRIAKRLALLSSAAALAFCVFPAGALAQTDTGNETEEERRFETIVVTSKGIEQSVYEAPVAVTTFSADQLEARNAVDLIDIGKYVPNLTVTSFGAGSVSSQFPSIRGIGFQDHLIVVDPTVGVYVDGVYLGRQIGQNLNLSNIEQIEVLRGPQGTLFGRNSIGGAVNIITKQAGSEEIAKIDLQAGSRGRFGANFYGNTRLHDTFAVSANFGFTTRNGIGDFLNIDQPEARVGELQDISGRVSAKWTPNDRFSLQLTADGNESNNGQSPFTTTIVEPPNGLADCPNDAFAVFCAGITQASQSEDPFDTNSGQADLARTTNSAYGFSGILDYAISDTLDFKLIGSYRFSEYEGGLDDDGAEVDFLSFPEEGEAEQFSFEAKLSGQTGIFDYVGGFYYFEEDGFNFQPDVTFNSFTDGLFLQAQDTQSWAIFANAGVQLTDALRISGGIRFTSDEKDAIADVGFAPQFGNEADFDEVTWEVSATYNLTDNLSTFATVARGFQSGQFPARPFFAAFANDLFAATDPVIATNYEGGIKGEPFEWLQMSLSGFYTEYDDFPGQVSFTDATGFNTATITADSRAFGVEWEGNFNFGNFSLNTSVGFIDAEFTNVPIPIGAVVDADSSINDGDTPALTPRWTVAIGPQYTFNLPTGDLTTRLDYSFRDDIEGAPNNSESTAIDSRDLLGFDVTYASNTGDWTFGIYGKNVTDERYVQAALDVGPYILNILNNDVSEFGAKFSKVF